MEIILLLCGIAFLIVGITSLIKAGWSEEARYSWRTHLLIGVVVWVGLYLLLRNRGAGILGIYGSQGFSFVCLIVGLSFLIWNKHVARVFFKLQLPALRFMYGNLINWEKSWVQWFIRGGFVFAGLILIGIAWANYYGSK